MFYFFIFILHNVVWKHIELLTHILLCYYFHHIFGPKLLITLLVLIPNNFVYSTLWCKLNDVDRKNS